ncbi:MAG: aminomethyl transferase family protein [Rhodospirillales bacterium]|jgi:aminomethyltransferase|nr:aminomethyl transferase family protein [Rhodospirillales bacterium]
MAKRTSTLGPTLLALGAEMGEWNNMDVAFGFPWDMNLEHDAIRETVGMWDTSALTKIQVHGPDALAAMDYLVTRDMSKIYVGKSAYCPILKDNGHFCDDGIAFHVEENHLLLAGSIGPSYELLQEYVKGKNMTVELDDDLHIITVQGPNSIDFLDEQTEANLRDLAFSHQIHTKVCGVDMMVSRTGYSGERGYELYMRDTEVVGIWDELMEKGQDFGLKPISFGGLEMVHIESGLMAYGAEATEENTPWEVNMGWAVSRKKGDFRGKEAVFALEGKEKVKYFGIVADHDDVVEHGAELSINGEVVGHVTTPAYSKRMGQSQALVHLTPSAAVEGTKLDLKGPTIQCTATATSIPFVDPGRTKQLAN